MMISHSLHVLIVALALPLGAFAEDWPQWLGPQGDSVWREKDILEKFPKDGPKVLWRMPLGGGYTGPSVSNGFAYVMDRQNPPKGESPKEGQKAPRGTPVLERILCLEAKSGKQIWEQKYPCRYRMGYPTGPRTTPVVQKGRVYTLGAMGDLQCRGTAKGKLIWGRKLAEDFKCKPPVWGWSATPLLKEGRLFCLVGGKGSAIVAFNPANGKELWRALTSEEVCYAPPILVEAGKTKQLIVWLSDAIYGLNPSNGNVHWSHPYPADGKPQRPAVSISTPRYHNGWLFVSAFYHGSLMLKLDQKEPKAEVAWRSKSVNPQKPDALHCIMGTPMLSNSHIYGICGFGQLRCLAIENGKQKWETFAATGGKKGFLATAFIIAQGKRFFLFNDQGDLIIARMTPKGYKEVDRAHLIEPSQNARGRQVVWCHPAFANRCLFVRNDKEMICVSLAAN